MGWQYMPDTLLSIFIHLFLSKYLSVFLLGTESITWTEPWQTPALMDLPFQWRDRHIERITQMYNCNCAK